MRTIGITILLLCIAGGIYLGIVQLSINSQATSPMKSRRDITFYVDDAFTEREVKDIKSAGNDWMRVIDGLRINFEVRHINSFEMFGFMGDSIQTIYKASSFGIKRDFGKAMAVNSNVIGLSLICSGDIFIFVDDEDIFKYVVIHEIGHILAGNGRHLSNGNTLMYYQLHNLNIKITTEDINFINLKEYIRCEE